MMIAVGSSLSWNTSEKLFGFFQVVEVQNADVETFDGWRMEFALSLTRIFSATLDEHNVDIVVRLAENPPSDTS